MSESPRAKRHTLYYLNVSDGRSGRPLGVVTDIHLEGVSLQSETPLECPATLLLSIEIPQKGRAAYSLVIEAESRWTSTDPASGLHTTGFRCMPLSPEQRCVVERLIQDYGYSAIGELNLAGCREKAGPVSRPGTLQRFWQTLFTR